MDLDPNRILTDIWLNIRLLPWHWFAPAAHLFLAISAAIHAMLYKRDSRAALGWITICLFIPFIGPLFYYMFGINRIQTQARKLASLHQFRLRVGYERGTRGGKVITTVDEHTLPLQRFVQISDHVASRPLVAGNTVDILQNGEQAYPEMLAAINNASSRVFLVSYLFESDAVGEAIVEALISAHRRGVEVRVIVDGIGELYSWPRMSRVLHRAGVPVARFLPPKLLPPTISINLRNHRKILAVDSDHGFTGGMNIGVRHLAESMSGKATTDLHFHLRGAVVGQLEDVFIEDWRFVTGEELAASELTAKSSGKIYCRCITDGPNEDLDKISLVLMGAISAARHEIFIVTPYFLPSREMIASLQSAALRGVTVTIILPQNSNLPFVDWATRNLLWELLLHGVRVYYQPPPFSHAKLFIVDGIYAQIGSANMDPRSLRLNFELNMEVIGSECVDRLVEYSRYRHSRSSEITLQEIDQRGLLTRLRDATCWLFSPYL